MIETALSLEGFSLIVDGKKMLDNVSARSSEGQYRSSTGSTRSGKSAILRSLFISTKSSSMMFGQAGSIKLFGSDIDQLDRKM